MSYTAGINTLLTMLKLDLKSPYNFVRVLKVSGYNCSIFLAPPSFGK